MPTPHQTASTTSEAEPSPRLSELTTFRVGGAVRELRLTATEADLLEAVRGADGAGLPLLVIGGGSNLLVADTPFEGLVIHPVDAVVEQAPADEGTVPALDWAGDVAHVLVTASAGTIWDDLVRWSVERGLAGLEALSGIPGTVGAAPVQNIGAYGQDVSGTLVSVRALDRATGEVVTLSASQLDLSYRHSRIKESVVRGDESGRRWGPTGRWVVLGASFLLARSALGAPVRYAELAARLGVEVGVRAEARAVREAVLALRSSKGMVLDPSDHDTWSAGSFFMNPVLTVAEAERLPEDAPRFPDGRGGVKTSAAWLIQHAGFGRGWAPEEVRGADGAPRASLSTKHVLAVTNRGGASAEDIACVARAVRAGVRRVTGIDLAPEPVLVGVEC